MHARGRPASAPLAPVLALGLCLGAPALAQDAPARNGYDADIDLVRPMFSRDVLPGMDVMEGGRAGTVRWGLDLQYTRNPLVLYAFDDEVGPVVANRASGWLGVSVDVSPKVAARIRVPLHFQWGSQVPRYAADGFAIGDIGLGFHWAFYRRPRIGIGVRADVDLPTSRRDFYAGERLPRMNPALVFMFDGGRVRFVSDIGINVRFRNVTTTEEWDLGQELVWNNGLRVTILPEQLAAGLTVYSRFGFADFFGAEETSGEALLNLAYGPLVVPGNIGVTINLAGGRGFTLGYGSSDFRAYASLTFQRVRPLKPEEEEGFVDPNADPSGNSGLNFNVRDLGQLTADGEGELDDEPDWADGELARIDRETERIQIRYAIRFKVGTDELLPESQPTLDYISALLNNDARIAHIVIEGHASTDGEFLPNYLLSRDRAAQIWRKLVEQGVHPSRISYRGMGEVVPTDATGGYDEMQASRRVVFHITTQLEEWESPPEYDLDLFYPWSGEAYRAVQPSMPSPDEMGLMPDLLPPPPGEEPLGEIDFTAPVDEEPVFEEPPDEEPPPDDDTDDSPWDDGAPDEEESP